MNAVFLAIVLFAAVIPPLEFGGLLFVAWVPLLYGSGRAVSGRSSALGGAVFGAVYYGLLFRWMLRLPALFYVGACLLGVLYGAFVAFGIWRARGLPRWAQPAAAALLWIAPALIANNPLRPFFGSVVLLTGLPAPLPLPFLQLARPWGETGLVVFLVFINGLLWQAFEERAVIRRAAFAVTAAGLIVGAWAWGSARIKRYDAAAGTVPSFGLACAQHDLPFAWDWRASHQEETFQIYRSMALEAAGKGARMVFFPQYRIPQDIYRHPGRWSEIARQAKAYIVLGTYVPVSPGDYSGKSWVMGLVFSPEGKLIGAPVALRPSPFGRFSVVAGAAAQPVRIQDLGKLALLLCFDDVTSAPTRLAVKAGADIIASLANDGIFSGTIEPALHLMRSRLRAVESGKYFVRCITSDLSSVIDPVGRVRRSLPAGRGILFFQDIN